MFVTMTTFETLRFFTVESLKAMLGERNVIRKVLVEVLLEVSSDFAHRAVGAAYEQVCYAILLEI